MVPSDFDILKDGTGICCWCEIDDDTGFYIDVDIKENRTHPGFYNFSYVTESSLSARERPLISLPREQADKILNGNVYEATLLTKPRNLLVTIRCDSYHEEELVL